MDRRHLFSALARCLGSVALGGCGSTRARDEKERTRSSSAWANAEQTGPTHDKTLIAAVGEADIGWRRRYKTWLYEGQFPGPEIRLQEGDRLRIQVVNQLPAETTVHWHGIPVPNAMDGVPDLTQKAITPGTSFLYDFVAAPAGSYMYHSHVGLQLDRGLLGALIIEERSPHVQYDRDYTVMLDDFLPSEPEPLGTSRSGMGGMMRGRGMMGRGGMMRGGMMGIQLPPYEALLMNGRLPENPPTFPTRTGDRIRFRCLNPSGATTYRVAIAGHRMEITHTDGRPVHPLAVDSFFIGMGERYDVVVTCRNPGQWPIVASPVEGSSSPARGLLQYTDAARGLPSPAAVPEGLQQGRVLELQDLRALKDFGTQRPDRTLDLVLSGGMMSSAWTINGQAYPDADPVEIEQGERIRVQMVNHSMMIHPMHLHGHFFKVHQVLKDTVNVPPHMGRVSFDFVADNPGRWFFHCHNIYHMESGMAREIRYV